jgi:DNA-binding MarR family transcriptional regulator
VSDSFDADDIARLRIALARVSRVLDRQSRGGLLSGTAASVLASTIIHGPLRISDLAELEGINPTMLSRVVGKLDDAGLVARRADPRDGRAALVESTEDGLALHRTLRDERTRLLTERLAAMPQEQAAQLLAALPALEALAQISTENS